MPNFVCYKCNYDTTRKTSMYTHLNKQIKCCKKTESLNYTDNELVKYSLIPYLENNNCFKNHEYTVERTQDEFINEIKSIFNQKRRNCNHCNMIFQKYKDLENHLFYCVFIPNKSTDTYIPTNKDTNKDTNKNTSKDTNKYINKDYIPINHNIIQNEQKIINYDNCNNTQNIQNNININIELPKGDLVSFNDKWCVDHIDKNVKTLLFMSTYKYTKTLEYILQNDKNRNVLLDNTSQTGLIYEGDKNTFSEMKIEDIVDKSLKKLYDHLNEFHEDISNSNVCNFMLDNEIIKANMDIIEKKINGFNESDKIKQIVTQNISDIFNKYKTETKDKYQTIQDENMLIDLKGY